jgi:hypothetical protein
MTTATCTIFQRQHTCRKPKLQYFPFQIILRGLDGRPVNARRAFVCMMSIEAKEAATEGNQVINMTHIYSDGFSTDALQHKG